ncbi:c-type cytochrome [Effusibacillus consociatus]|uniref:C-type cytochrome n=1 Tax=Effusibacillus consociatus TaxID=1117041 RepID=A0ABV9Q1B7_9BACL
MNRKFTMSVALGVALIATGCATKDKQEGQPAVSDIPAAYRKNCSACHGSSLEGRSGPNLTKVGGKLPQEQIKLMIEKGGRGMPPFKDVLTAEEINEISNWLAAKK